jgi:hypothetical protein
MDKDTVEVITQLNIEQSRQFEKLLESKEQSSDLKLMGVRKTIEAGLETVALELAKRNGTISEIQKTLCEVKDHTSWWRFFQRNPKITIVLSIFTIVGFVVLFGFKVPVNIDDDKIGISIFQFLIEKLF